MSAEGTDSGLLRRYAGGGWGGGGGTHKIEVYEDKGQASDIKN